MVHPQNVGALVSGLEGFVSCTPAGVIQLLKRSDISIAGKNCVVIGRSNIVGKPMALLMLRENATVTIAHSKTNDLQEICKKADILIVAVGKPKMIDESYIKEGAVVIDVGIHRKEDQKLCGDVDFDRVLSHVSAITPVPGGVGPMTIAMLMNNVIKAAKEQHGTRAASYCMGRRDDSRDIGEINAVWTADRATDSNRHERSERNENNQRTEPIWRNK